MTPRGGVPPEGKAAPSPGTCLVDRSTPAWFWYSIVTNGGPWVMVPWKVMSGWGSKAPPRAEPSSLGSTSVGTGAGVVMTGVLVKEVVEVMNRAFTVVKATVDRRVVENFILMELELER